MGLFNKKRTASVDVKNFRRSDREGVSGYICKMGDVEVEILDLSDGGMQVRTARGLKDYGIVEIMHRGKRVKRVVAYQQWSHNGRAGYSFQLKTGISTDNGGSDYKPAHRRKNIRDQVKFK